MPQEVKKHNFESKIWQFQNFDHKNCKIDIVELGFFYLEIIFSFWLAFIIFQILISLGGLLKNHKTEYVFIYFVEILLYGNCVYA